MRQRRIPTLKRHGSFRDPKRRFLIYCEGENTEREYFSALSRLYKNTLVVVEAIGPAGVPHTLATAAIKHISELGLNKKNGKPINSFEEHDQVWAVFDRDEHPKYYEAIELCEQNNVRVGRSNPCFEVWLILHIQDFDKPDGRHAVQKLLAKLRPEYDPKKGKCPNCDELAAAVEKAEKRARKQFQNRMKETPKGAKLGPPYTTVSDLTSAIREAMHNTR